MRKCVLKHAQIASSDSLVGGPCVFQQVPAFFSSCPKTGSVNWHLARRGGAGQLPAPRGPSDHSVWMDGWKDGMKMMMVMMMMMMMMKKKKKMMMMMTHTTISSFNKFHKSYIRCCNMHQKMLKYASTWNLD